MASTQHAQQFQHFLDEQVRQGTALGLQGVVFDRNGIVFSGVSGERAMGADGGGKGKPMDVETIHWVASCTKIVIALMVLRLLDKGVKGFTTEHLDDHARLIDVLPEFDHANKRNVTQIITGYEKTPGPDGKLVPILTPSKTKTTLRDLLTMSCGLAYYWNHELMKEWYKPSDESVPNGILAFASGRIADFDVPMVREGGTVYEYSPTTDWLGQFIIRMTGKNLRASFLELIVDPLDLPRGKVDMMAKHLVVSKGEEELNRASYYVRLPPPGAAAAADDQTNGHAPPPKFLHIPLPQYEPDTDEPPEGFAHFASANIFAPLAEYARILQAVLSHDSRLLSEATWKLAEQDNTTPRGVKMQIPNMSTHMPDLTYPIQHYFDLEKPTEGDHDPKAAINLFQAHVTLEKTKSGLSPGAFSWAGLANTFWFIDPVKGVGGVIGTQLLPFYDPQMVEARYGWEKLVTSTVE